MVVLVALEVVQPRCCPEKKSDEKKEESVVTAWKKEGEEGDDVDVDDDYVFVFVFLACLSSVSACAKITVSKRNSIKDMSTPKEEKRKEHTR